MLLFLRPPIIEELAIWIISSYVRQFDQKKTWVDVKLSKIEFGLDLIWF